MHILIAPQALKGSLTALEAGQAIAQGARRVFPTASIQIIPIADGGEGTTQALVDATAGTIIERKVTGPLGEPVTAFLGLLGNTQSAVIEMASCAGLPLVPLEKRDPRYTTTYGVGELIRIALDLGSRHIILGIGGSATNDGGAGMAQALGARLLTRDGLEIGPGGAHLAELHHIDLSTMDPRLQDCVFEVACDVTNTLCGPEGASAIYGPQKGATPEMVHILDQALAHYASIIARDLKREVRSIPGSGAAGGLGAGLVAFLGAALQPGAQIIFTALQMEQHIRQADLIITAEGQLDAQTLYGKSVGTLAQLAAQHTIPVIAIAGSLGEQYTAVYRSGIDGISVLPTGPMTLVYAMKHASLLTSQAAERALRMVNIGIALQKKLNDNISSIPK